MNEQDQTVFPSNGHAPEHEPAPAQAPAGETVMLEGMKVMFDDKVGLYPVDLVAKTPPQRGGEVKHNGQLGRTRIAARR